MNRTAVVMAGPLPPAVGGMAAVIGALSASSLPRRVELRLFETGKTTPEGRSLWRGITARLALMARWWRELGSRPRPLAHVHTCSGFTFFLDSALVVLSRLRGASVVMHVHGGRFDAFLDGMPRVLLRLTHAVARLCAAVVVLSPEWQRRLSARWPDAHIAVVSNGVAPLARARAVDAALPRFVFVGNIARAKGVAVLLQAAALAREPWQIELAGAEGEPGMLAWANDEIARGGLEARVRLLGPVVGAAKTELLCSAQGFVLPSLAEGLPMALLEAMACGLPPVVSDVGAMPEAVRDGVEGHVVAAGDATALAAALDALARSPAERLRLGAAAAERCDALYGIERMVDTLMSLYAGVSVGTK
jgi:glycosyltransferase involved in cell wall biosynthesis